MKIIDENVLEPLHLEAADLSSGRRLVKETARLSPEEDSANLTVSRLVCRGFLSKPTGSQAFKPPEGNGLPFYNYTMDLGRLGAEPPAKPAVVWVPVIPQTREGFDV